MVVIIPHPTEELKLINFQKELISDFFSEDRIIYSSYPLWIELPDFFEVQNPDIQSLKNLANSIIEVTLGELEITQDIIQVPVYIKTTENLFTSKLTLVILHSGNSFSERDLELCRQKNQPVNLLKIFRLGVMQEDGPHAKSISKSIWCKLK